MSALEVGTTYIDAELNDGAVVASSRRPNPDTPMENVALEVVVEEGTVYVRRVDEQPLVARLDSGEKLFGAGVPGICFQRSHANSWRIREAGSHTGLSAFLGVIAARALLKQVSQAASAH